MAGHSEPSGSRSSTSADPSAGGRPDRDGEHHHLLLLVEDDTDLRVAMQALLRLEGFQLLTAADGAEALAILQGGAAPCLILLDFSMPVSDGRDFRRHQLRDTRLASIPTVLFSAHDGIAQRATELGLSTFLPKPADFDVLADLVHRQCTACLRGRSAGS